MVSRFPLPLLFDHSNSATSSTETNQIRRPEPTNRLLSNGCTAKWRRRQNTAKLNKSIVRRTPPPLPFSCTNDIKLYCYSHSVHPRLFFEFLDLLKGLDEISSAAAAWDRAQPARRPKPLGCKGATFLLQWTVPVCLWSAVRARVPFTA